MGTIIANIKFGRKNITFSLPSFWGMIKCNRCPGGGGDLYGGMTGGGRPNFEKVIFRGTVLTKNHVKMIPCERLLSKNHGEIIPCEGLFSEKRVK